MSASTLRPKMKPFNNLKKEMLTMSCEELKELRARLGLCVYLSERPRSSERGKSVWEEKHEKQALYYCCPWKREMFFMEGERGELEDKDQKWLLKWSGFFLWTTLLTEWSFLLLLLSICSFAKNEKTTKRSWKKHDKWKREKDRIFRIYKDFFSCSCD